VTRSTNPLIIIIIIIIHHARGPGEARLIVPKNVYLYFLGPSVSVLSHRAATKIDVIFAAPKNC